MEKERERFMKDDFREEFRSMGALIGRMEEMVPDSAWIPGVETRSIEIRALPEYGDLPEEVKAQAGMSERVVSDTAENARLYCVLPDGRAYCLRKQALDSLHARAGVTGPAYDRLPPETRARHLNDGLSVAKGKCLVRVEAGKVLGIHSSAYAPFDMLAGAEILDSWVALEYPDAEFAGASMTHDVTRIRIGFSAYAEELSLGAGALSGKGALEPSLTVCMGDSARCSVKVIPCLSVGGLPVPLGDPMVKPHRGAGDPLEAFYGCLEMVEGQFERNILDISGLAETNIAHPTDTFLNMAKETGLLQSYSGATKQCAQEFEDGPVAQAEAEGRRLTALDVYLAMCGIPRAVVANAGKGADREALEEKASALVARAIKRPWKKFDQINKVEVRR